VRRRQSLQTLFKTNKFTDFLQPCLMQESPIHFVSHTEIIKLLELTLSNYIFCIMNPGTTTKDLLKKNIKKTHPVQDAEW